MKMKQLEDFLTIAKAGSFSAGAEDLFLTQSALSKQVQTLEDELGVTLFNRSSRGVTLTQEGKILAAGAPKLLEQYRQLLDQVNPGNYTLRIGVLPVIGNYGMTTLISDFIRHHPSNPIEIEEADNVLLRSGLDEGHYDFTFMRIFRPEKYRMLTVCRDELVLVVPASHPQAVKRTVSLKVFADENFILLNKGTQLYDLSIQACRDAGFSPKIYYTGNSGESIIRLVQSGVAIAIISKQVAKNLLNNRLKMLQFEETFRSEIVLACAADSQLNYSDRLFWQYARKQLSDSTSLSD